MPGFEFEQKHWCRGASRVAGVDEAGRGPLAGPVVAAAVVFAAPIEFPGLNDSKKLSAGAREGLYERLTGCPEIQWATAFRDAAAIDRLNILRATHEAMAEAVGLLSGVEHALVDGLPVRGLPVPHEALVGGDGRCASIAAASVIAKVTRDRMMREFDALYPDYGFSIHKGYPTAAHLAKLRELGPCPIHRRSFAPVAQTSLI